MSFKKISSLNALFISIEKKNLQLAFFLFVLLVFFATFSSILVTSLSNFGHVIKELNPFPNKPWFSCVCSTSLLETQREKEILRVMSNFSFCTVFSTHFENFRSILSNLKLLSANSFSLDESKICRLGKG